MTSKLSIVYILLLLNIPLMGAAIATITKPKNSITRVTHDGGTSGPYICYESTDETFRTTATFFIKTGTYEALTVRIYDAGNMIISFRVDSHEANAQLIYERLESDFKEQRDKLTAAPTQASTPTETKTQ